MNLINYPLPFKIAGIGRYVPPQTILSSDLEKKYGLSEGWCIEKQGIIQRHWSDGESASEIGAKAALEAIEDAHLDLTDIDLIINASGTPEQLVPDGGPLIQRALGLGKSGIPAITVNGSCLSFYLALDVSSHYLYSGRFKNILIVSADISSTALDFSKPENFTLFGDGAAAVVVTLPKKGELSSIHTSYMETYGYGADFSAVPGGGTKKPASLQNLLPEDYYLQMNGAELLKLSFEFHPVFLTKLWEKCTFSSEQIKVIIPHQPSRVVLDYLTLHFDEQKIIRIIEKYGNCVGASMPMALYEAIKTERLQRGDVGLLTGAGSGVSFVGMVFTY